MPGQNSLCRRLRKASCRPEFSSGIRSESRQLVVEGTLPAPLQSRCRCLTRLKNLHLRRVYRTKPLPPFQMLGGRDVRSVEWHEIYDPSTDKYTILGECAGRPVRSLLLVSAITWALR